MNEDGASRLRFISSRKELCDVVTSQWSQTPERLKHEVGLLMIPQQKLLLLLEPYYSSSVYELHGAHLRSLLCTQGFEVCICQQSASFLNGCIKLYFSPITVIYKRSGNAYSVLCESLTWSQCTGHEFGRHIWKPELCHGDAPHTSDYAYFHGAVSKTCLLVPALWLQFNQTGVATTVISQCGSLVKDVWRGNSCSVHFNSMVWSRSLISAVTRLLSQHWVFQATIDPVCLPICACMCLLLYNVSSRNEWNEWILNNQTVEPNGFPHASCHSLKWCSSKMLLSKLPSFSRFVLVHAFAHVHTTSKKVPHQPTGQPGSLKASGTGLSSLQIIL